MSEWISSHRTQVTLWIVRVIGASIAGAAVAHALLGGS